MVPTVFQILENRHRRWKVVLFSSQFLSCFAFHNNPRTAGKRIQLIHLCMPIGIRFTFKFVENVSFLYFWALAGLE